MMMSAGSHRRKNLDLVRSVATVFIFVEHFFFQTDPIMATEFIKFGWPALDSFFIMSGYLVTISFLYSGDKDNPSPVNYYIKRVFRILPTYFFVLFVFAFVLYPDQVTLPLSRYVLFIHNFHYDWPVIRFFGQSWTIAVEEQFYLSLPLLIIFFRKAVKFRPYIISSLLLGVLACWGSRWWSWVNFVEPVLQAKNYAELERVFQAYYHHPTYNNVDNLILGTLIGIFSHFYSDRWLKIDRHSKWIFIAGLSIFSLGYVLSGNLLTLSFVTFGRSCFAIGLSAVIVSMLLPSGVLTKKCPDTYYLSRLCLQFYLIHLQVIEFSIGLFKRWGLNDKGLACLLFSLSATYLLSYVLYLVIEKPFFRIRDRILSK